MKIVGRRLDPAATVQLSARNLEAVDGLATALRDLAGGTRHFFPKGIYRYRSHEEAEAAWVSAVARDMAELERERRDGPGKVRSRRDAR